MKAYKCDRCGDLYQKGGVSWSRASGERFIGVREVNHIDLCDDCWRWLNVQLQGAYNPEPRIKS